MIRVFEWMCQISAAENEPCKVCMLSTYYYRSPRYTAISPLNGVGSLQYTILQNSNFCARNPALAPMNCKLTTCSSVLFDCNMCILEKKPRGYELNPASTDLDVTHGQGNPGDYITYTMTNFVTYDKIKPKCIDG